MARIISIMSTVRLLLLLITLTAALVPRSDVSYNPLLGLRARSSIDPICVAGCDGTTCGGGSCGVRSNALSSRSLVTRDDLESNPLFRSKQNNTANEPLAKRNLGYKAGDRTAVATWSPTEEEADQYIRGVLLSAEDDYFGEAYALTLENTNAARSRQAELGDQPFQITSDGLYGCTVVTIMSRRAVWMAHFWETYSFGEFGLYQDVPDDYFQERVLDFINGIPIVLPTDAGPGTGNPFPYEEPSGPSINSDFFQDAPVVGIMTPRSLLNPGDLEYPNKVQALIDGIGERLGFNPRVITYGYDRINPNSPEWSIFNRGRRGNAIFQYDPNWDNTGNGNAAFRLFYEGHVYFDFVN